MENYLVIFTFAGALAALLFAVFTARKVLKFSEGTERMQKISASIRSGANAYLKRQYTIVVVFFVLLFLVFGGMALGGLLSPFVPFAFLTGGFFSGLSGFVGMKIATASNARTANACREGLNRGLRVAFSAGSVMGFTVVGLGLLDISIWFFLLKYVLKQLGVPSQFVLLDDEIDIFFLDMAEKIGFEKTGECFIVKKEEI